MLHTNQITHNLEFIQCFSLFWWGSRHHSGTHLLEEYYEPNLVSNSVWTKHELWSVYGCCKHGLVVGISWLIVYIIQLNCRPFLRHRLRTMTLFNDYVHQQPLDCLPFWSLVGKVTSLATDANKRYAKRSLKNIH